MVFDGFRQSFDDLLHRAPRPEDRRVIASRMRDTLVQAKVGLSEMRDGLAKVRQRALLEERDLETVRRRRQLAEGIGDSETAAIAVTYEATQVERVEVSRQKLAAREAEVQLAERDVQRMSAELKAVLAGTDPRAMGGSTGDSELGVADEDTEAGQSSAAHSELDAMARARIEAEREADAARRLDELKRRMGM